MEDKAINHTIEDCIQVGDNIVIFKKDEIKEDDTIVYRYRCQNSSNQTIELSLFLCNDEINKRDLWSVRLFVNSKKSKGYEYLKQTGKAGIESLIIAKSLLKYHIDNTIVSKSKTTDQIVLIWADDSRRFKAYEWGLKDIGFKQGYFTVFNMNSGKCLYKAFKKNNES